MKVTQIEPIGKDGKHNVGIEFWIRSRFAFWRRAARLKATLRQQWGPVATSRNWADFCENCGCHETYHINGRCLTMPTRFTNNPEEEL